jgi:hypothetical protein
MPRPHEDRQRHTLVDHHTGGTIVSFAPGSWWAISIADVAAARALAGVATYETLIEKARVSAAKAHEAVVFRSHNHRRVIALLRLDGHEAFRHLTAAWDDHHLFAERHAVAQSHSLNLYRLATTTGEAAIDPASTDAYAFEHLLMAAQKTEAVTAPIIAAPGFRGISIFDSDDDRTSAIIYRVAHVEEIEAFRATPEAPVHVLRTFE